MKHLNEPSKFFDDIAQLWDYSTGGGSVAAQPGDAGSGWISGPRPAGVQEGVEWFRDALQGDGVRRLFFLVGGPGAGKSHAAAEVVSDLEEVDPREDGLAHRSYRYRGMSRGLLVVNDATISSDSRVRGALVEDLDLAEAEDLNVMACVNRGVLVEELSAIDTSVDQSAAALLRWISSPDQVEDRRQQWWVRTDASSAYLRLGTLMDGQASKAEVWLTFVDVCSLFEVTPTVITDVDDSGSTAASATPYQVLRLSERSSVADTSCAAGQLLEAVISRLGLHEPSSRSPLGPIDANILSLASPTIRQNLLSVLRASEIVSTQRLTFREVWGVIARCILGDAPSYTNVDDLEEYLRGRQRAGADKLGRFEGLQSLAGLRFFQALFGAASGPPNTSQLLRNPVTRILHTVDPVRDELPGFNSGLEDGWASNLSDAFAHQIGDGSPLEILLRLIEEEDPVRQVVTDFDRELDRAYAAVVSDGQLKDQKRYELIAWYSAYLARMYAVANGIPAFRAEVETLTTAWALSPKIPDKLEKQLLTLFKPERFANGNGTSLVPILESRTTPIIGISKPVLAMRASNIEMETTKSSDSLFLHVTEGGRTLRRVVLDFPLVREAAACAEGQPGVTEVSDATSPRLERFRSTRLVPGKGMNSQRYRVVSELDDEVLGVGGGS